MIENRLTPALTVELKLAGAESPGQFQGYASTFGNVDSYGDTIAPGAFAATLAEHKANGSTPALLWAHDPNEPIGRWLSLAEDRAGLAVEGRLTIGTRRGSEARALMIDDALGLSIGFRVRPNGAAYEGGRRLLKAVDLIEISAVALPANPEARVTGVKSMAGVARPENIRDFEAALRDALGFSQREAKRIASAGWPALLRRDDACGELLEVAAILRKNISLLTDTRN